MSTRRIANFTRNVDETGKLTLSALSSDINPSAVAVYDSAGSLPDINLVAGKLAIETQTGNVYVSDASTWHILQRAEPTAVPTVISFSNALYDSSWSILGESWVNAGASRPSFFQWSHDGTKIFFSDPSIVNTTTDAGVQGFDCAVPWDLNSRNSFTTPDYEVTGDRTDNNYRIFYQGGRIKFFEEGSICAVLGGSLFYTTQNIVSYEDIWVWKLATPYDINGINKSNAFAVLDNINTSAGTSAYDYKDFEFGNNGRSLYLLNGDNRTEGPPYERIQEFIPDSDGVEAYDVSQMSLSNRVWRKMGDANGNEISAPLGMSFSPDGYTLVMQGQIAQFMNKFSLSAPFNLNELVDSNNLVLADSSFNPKLQYPAEYIGTNDIPRYPQVIQNGEKLDIWNFGFQAIHRFDIT